MLGELSNPEIDQLLNSQAIGRIGCHAAGKTYIVPVTFAFDGKYLYGHSREGKKIKMMRQNPNVCFEVDVMENLGNWKSVIIQGRYQELLGTRAIEAMQLFMKQLKPHILSKTSIPTHGLINFQHMNRSGDKSIVFRIEIFEKTGRFERQP